MVKDGKSISYKYIFECSNGFKKEFDVNIDPDTLILQNQPKENLPDWTKLKNFKCSHCPLNEKEHIYCPVATNLSNIISFFEDIPSFQQVKITVVSHERNYVKNADVQTGVSSLLGLIMASSGCPIVGKLKTLVKFHLPFANIEETEFKIFSMYLLAQYFKMKKGGKPDWEMKKLNELYNDIMILNKNVAEKIAEVENKDASINAVVVLNNFADSVTFGLDMNALEHLEQIFDGFL